MIEGVGLTPPELEAIKARWGLVGNYPHPYVEFAQAQADIQTLVAAVEREWSMPWKMGRGGSVKAPSPPAAADS